MPTTARPAQHVDVLGRPYYAETLDLPPDDEGAVVATLVHRKASRKRSRRAVLHLHGFCDYFFQTAAADFWTARGYDFYALDLRKYGRSLREHQTPNFARDLTEYFPEIDLAFQRVTERDGHDHVVLSGHSTGGLIGSLWADARDPALAGIFLNAPWLDMHGSFLLRTAGTRAIDQIGARRPYQEIPRSVSGLYARSLHTDHDGEWDFDVAWKPVESWPVYAGWVRAIRRGHATVHKGLSLRLPVLVMTSTQSVFPKAWEPAVDASDIVLDVAQIARWSTKLSRHVTLVRVEGALHDVTLSRSSVRERVFDELGRWLGAYVEPPSGVSRGAGTP